MNSDENSGKLVSTVQYRTLVEYIIQHEFCWYRI